MRYEEDKEFKLVFDKRQYAGDSPMAYGKEYYAALVEKMDGNGPQVINNMHGIGRSFIAAGAVLFASFLLGLMAGRAGSHFIFHTIAAAVCVFAGMLMIRSDLRSVETRISYDPDRRITGVIFFIAAMVILILLFTLKLNTEWERSYFIAGAFITVMAVYNLTKTVLVLTKRQRLYSGKITAVCVGYVRYLSHTTANGRRTNSRTVCYSSPVFEYEVNGQTIRAVYDRFDRGLNPDIMVGETVALDVNKTDYELIMNPSHVSITKNVIFFIIFAVIGIAFMWGAANGHVDGSSIWF